MGAKNLDEESRYPPSDINGINLLQTFRVNGRTFFVALDHRGRLTLCLQEPDNPCVGRPCTRAMVASGLSAVQSAAVAGNGFWSLSAFDFVRTAKRWDSANSSD